MVLCSMEGNDMKKILLSVVCLIIPSGCMAPGRIHDSHLVWDMQEKLGSQIPAWEKKPKPPSRMRTLPSGSIVAESPIAQR